MSLADNIKQMRADGCTEQFIYAVMLISVLRETVESLEAALIELDGTTELERLREKVTQNVAAAAIQVGANTLAQRDIDITLHYLASVARVLNTDEDPTIEPVVDEPATVKTPKDTSKLN